jgi:Protein of unknown function (DUF2782)
MKISPLPALLVIVASLSSFPVPSADAAGPEALPPPTHSDNAPDANAGAGDGKTGVQKELAPPPEQEGVQIRSYQRSDGAGITEYSMHGKVYMIKVQPPDGMPAYFLYDSNGDGHFDRRLPGNYKFLSPPTWVIKRF